MARRTSSQRQTSYPYRRDAMQARHTLARGKRLLESADARAARQHDRPESVGQNLDLSSDLPSEVFAQSMLAIAGSDAIEPLPTKVAGVVLATVATAMASGMPAMAAASPGAGGTSAALSHAPLGPALQPPSPPVALEAVLAGIDLQAAPRARPARRLLDVSSDIGALVGSAGASYTVNDYGATLQANKQAPVAGVVAAGGSFNMQCLVVAVGMLETNHMAGYERDSGKDGNADGSENCSPLNICVALWNAMGVTDVGWMNQASVDMNRLGQVFTTGLDVVGVNQFVGFTRVGSDWANPNAQEQVWMGQYRQALGTVIQQLQADPSFLNDSRRVDVSVPYIG